MGNPRSLLVYLCVVATLGAVPSLANPPVPPISALAVQPASIELLRFDPEAHATANAIARVSGAGALPAEMTLSSTAPPGLDVRIGSPQNRTGDIVWPVTVSVAGDAPDSGTVDLRLAYAAGQGGTGEAVHAIQRATLTVNVQPARYASPAADADVSIKTDSTDVSEGVPITAYLVVANKSAFPFAVKRIDTDSPGFLDVTHGATKLRVPGHEAVRVPFRIAIAKDQKPQTGQWLILVRVTLSRGAGAREQDATVIAQQKVHAGVHGVSDVLTVLGLPSLLLVPGALILATWSLLFGATEAGKYKWLEWKSTGFWVVAITLSIFVFGAQILFGGTNFLVAYGISDVALLWIFCVGLGSASWGVYRAAVWGWTSYWEWRAMRDRDPQSTDQPIDILRKLLNGELSLLLPSYKYAAPGISEQDILKTGFPAPDAKQAWIIPRMMCRKSQEALDGKVQQNAQTLMEDIANANGRANERPKALFELLEKGLKEKWITVTWEAGRIDRPRLLPLEGIGTPGMTRSPVAFS